MKVSLNHLLMLSASLGLAQAEDKTVTETEYTTLENVTIIGSGEELVRISGSAHQLDIKKLEVHEYEDIHRILAQVPGVYVRGEDGFGLRPNIGLRGANSDRSAKVTLMEDGILFAPAPYSAPAAYYFPMAARLHGVEVFKGPASVKYGPHTIGGAINLQTTPIPQKKGGEVDVAYGEDNSIKLHANYCKRWDKGGFLIEGIHAESDGFKELDGGGDTGYDKNEIVGKLEFHSDLSAKVFQSLSLKFSYADEESDETYLGISDSDFSSNPYRRYAGSMLDHMNWDRKSFHVQHYVSFDSEWELTTNLYHHDFSRAWKKLNGFKSGPALKDIVENPNSGQSAVLFSILRGEQDSTANSQTLMIGTNARDFISQGISTAFSRDFGTNVSHRVEIGARYHNDEIIRLHDEEGYAMTNGRPVRDNSATAITTSNMGQSDAIAFYVHDEIQYKAWTLTPGMRVEFIETQFDNRLTNVRTDNDQNVVIPGMGFHYQINEQWGVLGGIHKGFSPVAPQANQADEEESVNYELGFRKLGENSSIEAIAFLNDYSNLTATGTFSQGFTNNQLGQQFSGGEVDVWGLEAVYKKEFRASKAWQLPVNVSYTYTQSEFKTSFSSTNPQFGNVTAGDELAYVPKHQLAVQVGVSNEKWQHGVSLKLVSEMRDTAGSGTIAANEKIDSHTVVDYAVTRNFDQKHFVYLKAENVFDKEYIISRRPYGARPGRPLHLQVGYKLKF